MSNDLSERKKVLDQLNNIIATQSNLAGANFDVDNFMNLVVEEMQRITPATGVVVELVEGDDMVYRAATGTVKNHIGLHLARKNSISGLCVQSKDVLRSDDTEQDPRVNAQACRLVGARSLVVAPLFHEAEAVGVLKILSREPSAFSEQDVQTLKLMAGLIGSALAHQMHHEKVKTLLEDRTRALEELKKAEEKLQHMANYDNLTDLPNRSLLTKILSEMILHSSQHNKLFALFFLDIDGFKNINDTLGHAIGDELLKAFALRAKQCIRNSDTMARLGGDEFVIVLDEVPKAEVAISIAEKIIAKMQERFVFEGKEITITTSIGIAFFDNNDLTADVLLKNADIALYDAKKSGKNRYKIFNNQN